MATAAWRINLERAEPEFATDPVRAFDKLIVRLSHSKIDWARRGLLPAWIAFCAAREDLLRFFRQA